MLPLLPHKAIQEITLFEKGPKFFYLQMFMGFFFNLGSFEFRRCSWIYEQVWFFLAGIEPNFKVGLVTNSAALQHRKR